VTAATAGPILAAGWRRIAAVTLGFILAYHATLAAVLVIRFGHLPNYATLYDWPANIARILRSTPSVRDALPIALDEWLLELGYMDPAYGHGIAVWSLAVLPAKLLVVALTGVLVGANAVLLRAVPCPAVGRYAVGLGSGAGAGLAGLASASVTWVVCCGTPSWAITLSMLGVDISAALRLQPLGPWLQAAGLALPLLGLGTLWRRAATPPGPALPRLEPETP
jgi:hypothetical protein